jgi:nucleoside-triphosphatase
MAKLNNFLLRGEPGIGKTTLIHQVLADLPVQAAGFFTREIRSGKKRVGFELVTLDGRQGTLAHLTCKSSYKVGNYGVDLKVMERLAVPALESALKFQAPLIVIDEIGKMECFSKKFRDLTIACLDSPMTVFGSVQTFSHPMIEMIMNRPDVVLIEVTAANRDQLVHQLGELLKLQLPEPPRPKRKKRKKRG